MQIKINQTFAEIKFGVKMVPFKERERTIGNFSARKKITYPGLINHCLTGMIDENRILKGAIEHQIPGLY